MGGFGFGGLGCGRGFDGLGGLGGQGGGFCCGGFDGDCGCRRGCDDNKGLQS